MELLLQLLAGASLLFVMIGLAIVYRHYVEFKKSTGGKPLSIKLFTFYALFIISLLVTIPILFFFSIYCQILAILLKIRYISNFGGMLEGTDAIHTIDEIDVSKNVGNILFIIKHKTNSKDFGETVRDAIIKRFAEHHDNTPKLWFTWHNFSGFSYYLKNQISAEECVRPMEKVEIRGKERLDRSDLLALLSKYSNTCLPKNHSALWEVLVGSQPVEWKEGPSGVSYYPIILRIHHCLSDATELLKGFVRIFGDVKEGTCAQPTQAAPKEQITINLSANKIMKITAFPILYLWNALRQAIEGMYCIIMIPSLLILQGMLKANDHSCLHGLPLSGEKHLLFNVEERPHYVQTVKQIKNRVPDTTFSDVVLAAISAGFSEYFEKGSKDAPNTVSAMVPVFPGSSRLANFVPRKRKPKRLMCRNRFSLAILSLPVLVDKRSNKGACEKCNSIKNRLELVKRESRIFKGALDFQVNYVILSTFVGILPLSIRRAFSNRFRSTFMASIIPAPPAITALGGYSIQDVVFWVPNRGPIGMGFSVISYDGRFQIGLIVDKALIPEAADAQNVLDGIHRYLDMLNVESDCSRV